MSIESYLLPTFAPMGVITKVTCNFEMHENNFIVTFMSILSNEFYQLSPIYAINKFSRKPLTMLNLCLTFKTTCGG